MNRHCMLFQIRNGFELLPTFSAFEIFVRGIIAWIACYDSVRDELPVMNISYMSAK